MDSYVPHSDQTLRKKTHPSLFGNAGAGRARDSDHIHANRCARFAARCLPGDVL